MSEDLKKKKNVDKNFMAHLYWLVNEFLESWSYVSHEAVFTLSMLTELLIIHSTRYKKEEIFRFVINKVYQIVEIQLIAWFVVNEMDSCFRDWT